MNTVQTYKDCLDAMEDMLLTPIIPGELECWLTMVQESAETTGAHLWRQIETVHNPDFDEIVQRDPELFHPIDQLRQRDKQTFALLEKMLDHVSKLKGSAARLEPDEAALQVRVEALTQDGLAFVLHAKRQEQALETYFTQSFNRVRGVVD